MIPTGSLDSNAGAAVAADTNTRSVDGWFTCAQCMWWLYVRGIGRGECSVVSCGQCVVLVRIGRYWFSFRELERERVPEVVALKWADVTLGVGVFSVVEPTDAFEDAADNNARDLLMASVDRICSMQSANGRRAPIERQTVRWVLPLPLTRAVGRGAQSVTVLPEPVEVGRDQPAPVRGVGVPSPGAPPANRLQGDCRSIQEFRRGYCPISPTTVRKFAWFFLITVANRVFSRQLQ